MTWLRIDDKMMSHPKVLSIPRAQRLAVLGLWLAGATWCAGQLTDGALPAYMLAELGGSKRQAQALVDAGLWEDRGTAGWEYHDWAEYQPTREHVENERDSARERMRRLRGSSGDVRANKPRSSENVRDPRPDPSLPTEQTPLATLAPPGGPTAPKKAPAPRGTNLDPSWLPSPELRQWALDAFPHLTPDDLRAMHDEFVDYWRGVPGARGRKTDWPATWRNRIREQAPRRRPRGITAGPTALNLDAARARAAAREAATS